MNNNKLVGAVISSMVEKFQVIEIKVLNVEEGRLATSDYKITILLGQGQQISLVINYHARIKELTVKNNSITAMSINALSYIESITAGF
jgi:hypothetical protein